MTESKTNLTQYLGVFLQRLSIDSAKTSVSNLIFKTFTEYYKDCEIDFYSLASGKIQKAVKIFYKP